MGLRQGQDFRLEDGRAVPLNSIAEVAFRELRRQFNRYRELALEVGLPPVPGAPEEAVVERSEPERAVSLGDRLPELFEHQGREISFREEKQLLAGQKSIAQAAASAPAVGRALLGIRAKVRGRKRSKLARGVKVGLVGAGLAAGAMALVRLG